MLFYVIFPSDKSDLFLFVRLYFVFPINADIYLNLLYAAFLVVLSWLQKTDLLE